MNSVNTENSNTWIAYYRTSTDDQILGIEAQRKMVRNFVQACCGDLISEYSEHAHGDCETRPEFTKAIAESKATGARIIVAKLDRLARDVAYQFKLRKSGLNYLALDAQDNSTLIQAVFGGVSQHERERIADRTRQALAVLKSKGVKLGAPDPASNLIKGDAVRKASQARSRKARENECNQRATELISLYREKGMSLREIANKLNGNGHTTRYGKPFKPETVRRLQGISEDMP